MSFEESLRRIIEDNRKSRESSQDRFARLTDATVTGNAEEFTSAANEILTEFTLTEEQRRERERANNANETTDDDSASGAN